MKKYYLILLFIIFTSGCSTTKSIISKLPESDADYRFMPTELRLTYPAIDKYDWSLKYGIYWDIWAMPEIDDIKSKLGEPDKKRISWWNLYWPLFYAAFGLPPAWIVGGGALWIALLPTSVYHWDKPNYEIEAVVDNPMVLGYEPQLRYWRWKYKPEAEPGSIGIALQTDVIENRLQ